MVEEADFPLPQALAAEIVAHSQAGYPQEVCGLISGRAGVPLAVHRGRNVSRTPLVAYELDHETLALQIQFEDQGLELVAIYHSHPHGPQIPSETDVSMAFYPDAVYVIASLKDFECPILRAFRIKA